MRATLLIVGACGPSVEEACGDYVAASTACSDQAWADDPEEAEYRATIVDSCDAFVGLHGGAKRAAVQTFECFSEKVESADCSTPEGFTAMESSQVTCVFGG